MNVLDWLWRIFFGVSIHYLVKFTDITLIEPITNDLSIINSLFGGFLYTLGALPVLYKVLPKNRKTREQKKPYSSSRPDEQWLGSPMTPEGKADTPLTPVGRDAKYTPPVIIYSPDELNYSKDCKITWFFKESERIKLGSLIFSIEETSSINEKNEVYNFFADGECRLGFRGFGVSKSDDIIPRNGMRICSLVYENTATPQKLPLQSEEIKPTKKGGTKILRGVKKSPKQKKNARNQIQIDLSNLKKLKDEGLISDKVWEEKQAQILKDY